MIIFVLLSSQDGFSRDWVVDDKGHRTAPGIYNGAFSTIAFLLGAVTSILSGYLGMKIAVYANARTSLEARKGIAPAFMCGKHTTDSKLQVLASPGISSHLLDSCVGALLMKATQTILWLVQLSALEQLWDSCWLAMDFSWFS